MADPLALNLSFGDLDFVPVPFSNMQSAVFPLVWVNKGTVHGLGTAFMVSGVGVLATARHVVDLGYELGRRLGGGHLAYSYIGPSPDPNVHGLLHLLVPVDKVARPEDEDFALLTGMRAEFEGHVVGFPALEISLDLPEPGDTVISIGYTKFEMTFSQFKSSMSFEMHASRGSVVDVYPERRDSTAPFPCISFNARVDAGMSGGPVLRVDPDGRCTVLGLNFSSYPLNSDDSNPQHTSFCAATRCLLPLPVIGLNHWEPPVQTLLDLGAHGYLNTNEDFSRWTILSRDGRDFLTRSPSE